MRLIRYIFFIVILFTVIFSSCTTEENFFNFTTSYKNESGVSLTIEGHNSSNEKVYFYTIITGGSSEMCKTKITSFGGANCGADSIVIKFSNGRGFICTERPNSNNFCFGKSPLIGEESYFNEISQNTFEYIITQENYENAFDLPVD